MLEKVDTGILLHALSSVLSSVLLFLTNAVLAREVPNSAYAEFLIITSLLTIIQPLLQLNATGMVQPLAASSSPHKLLSFKASYLALIIVTGTLLLSVSSLLRGESRHTLLLFYCLTLAMNEVVNLCALQVGHIKRFCLFILSTRVAYLSLVCTCVYFGLVAVEAILAALCASEFLSLSLKVALFPRESRALSSRVVRQLRERQVLRENCGRILKFGVVGVPLLVLPWVIQGFDRLVMLDIFGERVLATYGAALAFSALFGSFNNLLSQIFGRIAFKRFDNDSLSIAELFSFSVAYFLFICLFIFLISGYSEVLFALAYSEKYDLEQLSSFFLIGCLAHAFFGAYRIIALYSEFNLNQSIKIRSWAISSLCALALFFFFRESSHNAVASVPLVSSSILYFSILFFTTWPPRKVLSSGV